MKSSYYDVGFVLVTDDSNNVYVAGYYTADLTDFDPGPDVYEVPYVDEGDLYIGKYSAEGNLIWVRTINGPKYEEPLDMVIDSNNDIYLAGEFAGTVDLDPGPGDHTVTGDDSYFSMFLLKLDSAGNTIWIESFIGENAFVPSSITLDHDQNLYITGAVSGVVDADPGAGVFMFNEVADGDAFVEKFDPSGNFLWGQQFNDGDIYTDQRIAVDGDNNIYLHGSFTGTFDADPGPGISNYTSLGEHDSYIMKWDVSGNLIWFRRLGSIGDERPGPIELSNSNDIYVSGRFDGSCDFDPGAGIHLLNTNGYYDAYLGKYSTDGDFIWAYGFGGTYSEYIQPIALDSLENIYMTGGYKGLVDFDPGPGVYEDNAGTDENGYILKLDEDANFIFMVSAESSQFISPNDIALDKDLNIIVHGDFSEFADFDPSGDEFELTGGYYPDYFQDVFVWKLNQDVCANMTLIVDSISPVNCSNEGYGLLHASNGASPYSYEWNTVPPVFDSVIIFNTPGIYTFTAIDTNTCERSKTFVINAPTTDGVDLELNIISQNFRPGFESYIWLDAFNKGCTNANGIFEFILNPFISFNESLPAPDFIDGDTLRWNFSDINYESEHLMTQINVTTSPDAFPGTIICNQGKMNVVLDETDTMNNYYLDCDEVIGSYDPNEKNVYPAGKCNEGYILNDQKLNYTLRFQNTGNAEAINVEIQDSLDANFDINSVEIISKSDYLYTEITDGHVLKFVFPDINLPDSTTNEPESHGFVTFQIRLLPGLAEGTLISNNAAIYFDFNDPIITNIESNVVVNVIPEYSASQSFILCVGDSVAVSGHYYSEAGSYLNALITEDGCDSLVTTNVTVDVIDTLVIVSDLLLTSNSPGPYYQWVDCYNNYTVIEGETNQTFSPVISGSYAVIVNDGSCSDTSSCVEMIVEDILNKNNYQDIKIEPNPGHELVEVKLIGSAIIHSVTVTDLQGKICAVFFSDLSGQMTMNIGGLNKGFYIFRVESSLGLQYLFFVKQ